MNQSLSRTVSEEECCFGLSRRVAGNTYRCSVES